MDTYLERVHVGDRRIKGKKRGGKVGGQLGDGLGEKRGESGAKVGRKWGENLSRNQTKILEAIAADPRITINGLSEKVGIGTTAVENNLKKLKSKGAMARVGSARGGVWRINSEIDFDKE